MEIIRLQVDNLRRLSGLELFPDAGLNLILGDNGAGKTSLLEAIHLLAYGRSFRGRVRDGLIRTDAQALEVFAEWREDAGVQKERKAGLRHAGQSWQGRLDGEAVSQLGELCAALAVVTFEPGSHGLISGGGEQRRRYLDWGLFHVEPVFMALWRRYSRALKQRNHLLKKRGRDPQLDAWDHELVEAGEPLTRLREEYLTQLGSELKRISLGLVPGLGRPTFEFQPGWRREELSLADALLLARDRDVLLGHTSVGPHRADWRLRHQALSGREDLSRGQAKLTALACVLAQAERHATAKGDWPVILLDDLASEVDRNHRARVLDWLANTKAQVFMTATDETQLQLDGKHRTFHVEHGALRAS